MDLSYLQPWEILMKRMVWLQLGDLKGRKILDFGSGIGVTADYLAACNDVVAIEPSTESIANRSRRHDYLQLCGSTERLIPMADETFDVIICHNVFEYASDRADIIGEFCRLIKPDGFISIVKHNRPGRVMQMVVLLNDFERANSLLDGCDGSSADFGAIHYYEDADIERWCPELKIDKTMGMRTFWDLQQNQEIQQNPKWQAKMLQIEMRVSNIKEYQEIAFFHHLIVSKR